MGRMIPTPNERAAIKQFLHECTDLHNPDATHIAHIEDMAVLMSEWLVHPAARAGEFLSAGGVN
jgi:hypothetical protein